jgi:hypothetical protein
MSLQLALCLVVSSVVVSAIFAAPVEKPVLEKALGDGRSLSVLADVVTNERRPPEERVHSEGRRSRTQFPSRYHEYTFMVVNPDQTHEKRAFLRLPEFEPSPHQPPRLFDAILDGEWLFVIVKQLGETSLLIIGPDADPEVNAAVPANATALYRDRQWPYVVAASITGSVAGDDLAVLVELSDGETVRVSVPRPVNEGNEEVTRPGSGK